MQIEQHFREILRKHAYVAIPGIGSFHKIYTSARIDREQSAIFPPYYDFIFDSTRTFNDDAILYYLINTYGVSQESAKRNVEEWLSTVEARLAMGETIEFDGIGSLCSTNGVASFNPLPAEKRATGCFGLTAVPLPPNLAKAKGKKNKKIRRSAILIPLFAILLGGGGYAAYYFLDWPYIISLLPWNSENSQPIAAATPSYKDSVIAITTPPRKIDSVVKPPEPQSTLTLVDSSLHQRSALRPIENNTVYYIIAGSFRSQENARKQVEELLNMGFKDPKIRQEKEFYQVYIAYYTSLPHAQAKLNELWNQYGEQFCFLNRVNQQ